MKKNKLGTIFFIIMTMGLLGVVVYFSMLLSSKPQSSVTQIKKTKASAQTYHKLLALNTLDTLIPTDIPQDSTTESSSSVSSDTDTLPLLSPTKALLAYTSISPTIIPTKIISPTIQAFMSPTPFPTSVPTNTPIPSKTVGLPSPTVSSLLVYRSMSITPTISITPTTSYQAKISPTKNLVQITGTVNKTLPESGWVQLSTILFIVAATTVFISFLF